MINFLKGHWKRPSTFIWAITMKEQQKLSFSHKCDDMLGFFGHLISIHNCLFSFHLHKIPCFSAAFVIYIWSPITRSFFSLLCGWGYCIVCELQVYFPYFSWSIVNNLSDVKSIFCHVKAWKDVLSLRTVIENNHSHLITCN